MVIEKPPGLNFALYACRFRFCCIDALHFEEGKSGNLLRGALGDVLRSLVCHPGCPGAKDCPERLTCPYARLFEPAAWLPGPSGFADWPRPFVLRAAHLDGRTLMPGTVFDFDLHVFDLQEPALVWLVLTFIEMAKRGFGLGRGRACLEMVVGLNAKGERAASIYDGRNPSFPVAPQPIVVSLAPFERPVSYVRIGFATPTELKSEERLVTEPRFEVLFARIRDRLSTLRALYGGGPLEIDFRGMAERAARVQLSASRLEYKSTNRRSSKTGQVSPLGGFVGEVEYTGDLTEFVPYLAAAHWTGVGRQTVWGKGALQVLEIA
jgi:hypothetical protein